MANQFDAEQQPALRVRRPWSSRFRWLALHIPFIGRLSFERGVPWKKAFAETGFSVVLGSLAVWIGIITLAVTGLESSLSKAAANVVSNGELFLLSSAAVAPLFYVTLIKYRPTPDDDQWITIFPHGVLYILCSIVILGVAIVYVAVRSIVSFSSVSVPFQVDSFLNTSWLVFWFSVFLSFTASVHKNILEGASAGVLRRDEGRFEAEFIEARDA